MKRDIAMSTIGIVRTPHTDPAETPVQPRFARGVAGRVELDPDLADGLDGIEPGSHVYLVSFLDRSRGFDLRLMPHFGDEERGVFATRSPRRPNPIGLSLVRVVGRDGAVLHVENVDLLDGTPLLDIKPYSGRSDEVVGESGERHA